MSEKIDWQILRDVPLFDGIRGKEDALSALSEIMVAKNMASGHTIIEEGKLGDELFVLCSGKVAIFKNTPDGDVFKVAILDSTRTPVLGEGALIADEPRSATVKTDSECQFLVLSRSHFFSYAEKHPEWAFPILQKIAILLMNRLRQSNTDLILLHKALANEIRT